MIIIIKIKLRYKHDIQLKTVLKMLEPILVTYKQQTGLKGKNKKAMIFVKV